jgi:hypothetical protein
VLCISDIDPLAFFGDLVLEAGKKPMMRARMQRLEDGHKPPTERRVDA